MNSSLMCGGAGCADTVRSCFAFQQHVHGFPALGAACRTCIKGGILRRGFGPHSYDHPLLKVLKVVLRIVAQNCAEHLCQS